MSKIKIFALGGLNDIGKNMYVVEVDKDIFLFDAGLKYADDKMLGVDYIIPNFDYLKENIARIQGLFITHGHQLQMGAVADILTEIPTLKIYGTAFTLNMLKEAPAAKKRATARRGRTKTATTAGTKKAKKSAKSNPKAKAK